MNQQNLEQIFINIQMPSWALITIIILLAMIALYRFIETVGIVVRIFQKRKENQNNSRMVKIHERVSEIADLIDKE